MLAKLCAIVSLIFVSNVLAIEANCRDLFVRKKIDPVSEGCILRCQTVIVDMSTFTCHEACADYCRDKCQSILENLRSRIAQGKPPNWPLKENQTKWSEKEINFVTEALSRLPDKLVEIATFSIYRFSRSRYYPNPATNAEIEPKAIVLYDTAFSDKYVLSEVISHELAHFLYRQISLELKESYNLKMNWFAIDLAKSKWISRKDNFVEDDGRDSPEEDFANNFEYYLFHPEKLKNLTPNAYDWIKANFEKISLKKGCRYAK